jgi:lactonase
MFEQGTTALRRTGIGAVGVLAALGVGTTLTSLTVADADPAVGALHDAGDARHSGPQTGVRTIHSTVVVKVSDRHDDSPLGPNYQSLLEGPAFGPDGDLYLTDAAAPAGEPKVLKVDLDTKKVTPLHTDDSSIYSSAQFSPKDGKLYLTDFKGRVERMEPDGSEVTTVFEGPVDGRMTVTDDIAFDAEGNMYITDFVGTPWEPTGRLVRLDADGTSPTVLQGGLARPNGIAFTPDYSRLWVAEQTANRISSFGLGDGGTSVIPNDAFIGMRVDNGIREANAGVVPIALDSTAVDADGNVYQAVHGGGRILVWNQAGTLRAVVTFADKDVTNLAIEPGTRNAYATVGGETGGFIYRFKALGEGIR